LLQNERNVPMSALSFALLFNEGVQPPFGGFLLFRWRFFYGFIKNSKKYQTKFKAISIS
jgi:hypothetical protein